MKTAKDIREYYDKQRDKEISNLRMSCKHEKISDWIDEWWAPAHSTGFQVKICEICEAILSRKTTCSKCGKIIVDDEIFEGDGQILPLGGYYCKDCRN